MASHSTFFQRIPVHKFFGLHDFHFYKPILPAANLSTLMLTTFFHNRVASPSSKLTAQHPRCQVAHQDRDPSLASQVALQRGGVGGLRIRHGADALDCLELSRGLSRELPVTKLSTRTPHLHVKVTGSTFCLTGCLLCIFLLLLFLLLLLPLLLLLLFFLLDLFFTSPLPSQAARIFSTLRCAWAIASASRFSPEAVWGLNVVYRSLIYT
jgi:hypothetical protein